MTWFQINFLEVEIHHFKKFDGLNLRINQIQMSKKYLLYRKCRFEIQASNWRHQTSNFKSIIEYEMEMRLWHFSIQGQSCMHRTCRNWTVEFTADNKDDLLIEKGMLCNSKLKCTGLVSRTILALQDPVLLKMRDLFAAQTYKFWYWVKHVKQYVILFLDS